MLRSQQNRRPIYKIYINHFFIQNLSTSTQGHCTRKYNTKDVQAIQASPQAQSYVHLVLYHRQHWRAEHQTALQPPDVPVALTAGKGWKYERIHLLFATQTNIRIEYGRSTLAEIKVLRNFYLSRATSRVTALYLYYRLTKQLIELKMKYLFQFK